MAALFRPKLADSDVACAQEVVGIREGLSDMTITPGRTSWDEKPGASTSLAAWFAEQLSEVPGVHARLGVDFFGHLLSRSTHQT